MDRTYKPPSTSRFKIPSGQRHSGTAHHVAWKSRTDSLFPAFERMSLSWDNEVRVVMGIVVTVDFRGGVATTVGVSPHMRA